MYDVTFVLGIPGVNSVTAHAQMDRDHAGGDSLLRGPGLAIQLQAEDHAVEAKVLRNRAGRLAQVRLTIGANDFNAAEKEANDLVMPVLSLLAFEADTPLEVQAILMTEQSSQTVRVSALMMGSDQPAPEVQNLMTPDLRPLLATYREGLNSTSPFYQALSFFKVMEGTATFHTKRIRAASKAGDPVPDDPLATRLPTKADDLPDLVDFERDPFVPYLGKTFGEVQGSVVDTVRNAIAHLTPGRPLRVPDYYDDLSACREVVPVLRYIARQLIRVELLALAGGVRRQGEGEAS